MVYSMSARILLRHGDITSIEVDAIVNAANNTLKGGGGVDGAIHRKGGLEILIECERIGGCPTGEAVITTAGNLPATYVIHTVGPVWKGGEQSEENLLTNSYKNSLIIARDHTLGSIAFPNISTGVYGFPKKLAAEIALRSVKEFLNTSDFPMKVIFVCFDLENYNIYNNLMKRLSS